MQSKITIFLGVLAISLLAIFCKKDEKPTNQKESPFYDFFQESSIVIDTVFQAGDSWEYGFVFTPLKSGKITHLGLKLPAVGIFTVTLWDLSGPAPVAVRSKTIDSPTKHLEETGEIPEFNLVEGKKMAVTVLSDAFYRITKENGGKFNFPKTIGSIRIESFNESINNTSTATFPTDTSTVRVAPCVNVIFIAD
jgi:hypothetical protein